MKKKVLLIYTELGFSGSYLIQAPISLVYVSTKIVNIPGVEVEILDCRIEPDWRQKLNHILINDDLLSVGFFVMSGLQVGKAHDVTRLIKELKQDIPIIWGGPHPTILPEEVLNYGDIDFCVRGFGVDAFTDLTKKLLNKETNFETIPNLCFINDNENVIGVTNDSYERINYKELPYHLLDNIIEKYFVGTENRAFPIYTAFGCPYQCNFCISPIWFKETRKKWDPLPAEDVVDHIEFLMNRYNIDFIYFWDDDTFVSPGHFSSIAAEILKRKLNIQLGIRGIRSNEIDRMKPRDFDLMKQVGVDYVHIGVENGSQKLLDSMDKGITVEQSISANQKLAKYDGITPMYNFLVGMPTETIEDLKQTGRFMLKLAEDNPNCIMYPPNKLIPYPGGKAFSEAVKLGYKAPTTPNDWINLDQDGEVYQLWYTPEKNRYMQILQIAAYGLSNWEVFLKNRPGWLQLFFKVSKFFYKPIAKLRLKYSISSFFIEYQVLKMVKAILVRISPIRSI
jgi:anaerobic magnesium-protoporphyrin IX monomethyl ester cyclase